MAPPPTNSTCSPDIGQWAVTITGSYAGQVRGQGLEARFTPAFAARGRVIRQSPRPRTSVTVYAVVTLRIAGS